MTRITVMVSLFLLCACATAEIEKTTATIADPDVKFIMEEWQSSEEITRCFNPRDAVYKSIDDRTIIFIDADGKVYRNTPNVSCPNMQEDSKINFNYTDRGGEIICKNDKAYVWSPDGKPMGACTLGNFDRLVRKD